MALRLLLEQEKTGGFLKDLFPARLQGMSDADRDLVRTLCLGVLRWKRLLDHNLDLKAPRGIRDPALRMLLRLGAYQLFFLSGIPAFAAVNTTVEIAKREFDPRRAGFANALLKALSRDGLQRKSGADAEALAVNFSHPDWLARRWSKALAPEALEAALRRNNEEAPLWIRTNARCIDPESLAEKLAGDAVETEPCPEAPLFLRIVKGADRALRGASFSGGEFSFQDPVAHWVISQLDWHPGQSVLDACAAPGGKSALLLEAAAWKGESLESARVVSADASCSRLRKIGDARKRLGHAEILPVCAALENPPFPQSRFDRVLVDAPCSNLGVLRRRPEARWTVTPEKIAALAARQKNLVRQAARLVAPGGRLVYAVCSAEAEETRDVANAFLQSPEGAAFSLDPGLVPEALRKEGFLWIYPGETEFDGFFAAALVRRRAGAA